MVWINVDRRKWKIQHHSLSQNTCVCSVPQAAAASRRSTTSIAPPPPTFASPVLPTAEWDGKERDWIGQHTWSWLPDQVAHVVTTSAPGRLENATARKQKKTYSYICVSRRRYVHGAHCRRVKQAKMDRAITLKRDISVAEQLRGVHWS